MPPNQRAWIVQKFHQADSGVTEAQECLARILATLSNRYPKERTATLEIITDLEQTRAKIRDLAIPTFTRALRGLHKPGDLATLVANAKPLPDPHYHSQTWAHQRTQPHRQPEHQRQLSEARVARIAKSLQEV